MNGTNVPAKRDLNTVRTLFTAMGPQLKMALPRHLTPDRLIRVALTAVQRNPRLLECTRESLAGALMECGQLGLEPDGILGQAYLIPRKNNRKGVYEANFMAGYKGLVRLARRSGEISSIDAEVVYERDAFRYTRGLHPVLEHEPYDGDDDPGRLRYAYAIARFKDGGYQFVVLPRREVMKAKASSTSPGDSPWVTHEDEMWKKTALRRLCKLLPLTPEAERAVTLTELAEAGAEQELGAQVDVSGGTAEIAGQGAAGSKLDQLAETLQDQSDAQRAIEAAELQQPMVDLTTGEILPEPSTLAPEPEAKADKSRRSRLLE